MYIQHIQEKTLEIPENNIKKIKDATQPGECVSLYSFESATDGFTAQLISILTNKRSVFIDNYIDLSYVFIQHDNTSPEILRARIA